MAYKTSFTGGFSSDLKSFKKNQHAMSLIKESIESILENPLQGEFCSGDRWGFRKYCFGRKPEYRLYYVLYKCCEVPEGDAVVPH